MFKPDMATLYGNYDLNRNVLLDRVSVLSAARDSTPISPTRIDGDVAELFVPATRISLNGTNAIEKRLHTR